MSVSGPTKNFRKFLAKFFEEFWGAARTGAIAALPGVRLSVTAPPASLAPEGQVSISGKMKAQRGSR